MSTFARYMCIVLFVKCGEIDLSQRLTWARTLLARLLIGFLPYLIVADFVWSLYIHNSS